MAGGLARHAAGAARRPLLVVLDCKGGESSRQVAIRARQVLREAGAARVAAWPQVPLSLWALPPRQLVTTLLDLIEHGTGGAAYYADVMESLVALAIGAPPGPPGQLRGVPGPAERRLARRRLHRRRGPGRRGGGPVGEEGHR